MKHTVMIKKGEEILYDGNLIDIPIKEQIIIDKSIDVFDDDDPCIIHQSYVIKLLVDELLAILKPTVNEPIDLTDYQPALHFLDLDCDQCTFLLKG